MEPMVRIDDLAFAYAGTDFRLAIGELSIEPGTAVAVTGPSGSGKTTLLHLIAGILTPESGQIVVDGKGIAALGDAARRAFRIQRIGLVFQEFELVEHLNVRDNILLPYRLSPALKLDRDAAHRATRLAESVGIADKLRRSVRRLSHGERQRVAVCRALLTEPKLLLADEPTGNLDPTNKDRVLDILLDYVRDHGATLITVTHDRDLLDRFNREIDFRQFHAIAQDRTAQEDAVGTLTK